MTRRRRKKSSAPLQEKWYNIDLHLHTPASADYQQEGVTYLDILKQAERQHLDILAFTDHNSVAGYKQMQSELEALELLERLKRLTPEEEKRLQEYRRLLDKIMLLKGFEFTATFGFHILGLFPPEMPIRDLEFLLLRLNVEPDKLDAGETEVGATSDVLTAYRVINEAGGIVIAAHANSSHGVALQGLSFGGQTRIAFTQNPNLHALEVTDLEKRGKTTARFFDGSKPEYPRKMHCVQGSDAHRLTRDPQNVKNLGIGERTTEVLLKEKTFVALRSLFLGTDFARTRPYRPGAESRPFDYVQAAREEGPNIVQEFHENFSRRGGYHDAIIADVCAFANTNGGALYIGVSADAKKPPVGIGASPNRTINLFEKEIDDRITPDLDVKVDALDTQGVKVVRIVVPRGEEPPYTLDESAIYLRSEAETTRAVRDEIVGLVRRGLGHKATATHLETESAPPLEPEATPTASDRRQGPPAPPRTGVEIARVEERKNTRYYTMRDLRNGSLVSNVTRRSARDLWRYAIEEAENNPVKPSEVRWNGDIGLWKSREHGKLLRYDLVLRHHDEFHVYYGVTEEGLHGPWATLIGE